MIFWLPSAIETADKIKTQTVALAEQVESLEIEHLAGPEDMGVKAQNLSEALEKLREETNQYLDAPLTKLMLNGPPRTLGQLDDTMRFLLGIGLLFVFYVVGEVSLILGKSYMLNPTAMKKLNARIAKVATIENEIITAEFTKHQSNIHVYSGLCSSAFLILILAISTLWHIGPWYWSIPIAFLTVVGTVGFLVLCGNKLGDNFDKVILLFENRALK